MVIGNAHNSSAPKSIHARVRGVRRLDHTSTRTCSLTSST
jgi:hypothetical protein